MEDVPDSRPSVDADDRGGKNKDVTYNTGTLPLLFFFNGRREIGVEDGTTVGIFSLPDW